MDEPLAEVAAYFRRKSRVPDQELVRLTAAAREGGSRWDAIAAGCGVRDYHDVTGVAGLPCWKADDTGAELLFSATQYAVEQLTGAQRRWPPLTWVCPGCGQQVTGRAPHSPRDRPGPHPGPGVGQGAGHRRERPRTGARGAGGEVQGGYRKVRAREPHPLIRGMASYPTSSRNEYFLLAKIYAEHGIIIHGLRTFQRLQGSLSHHSDRNRNAEFTRPTTCDSLQGRPRADQPVLSVRGPDAIDRICHWPQVLR